MRKRRTQPLHELLHGTSSELRRADWRLSHDGHRPVLERLPRLALELGDLLSAGTEPDPVTEDVRHLLAYRHHDSLAEPLAAEEWWQTAYRGGGPAQVAGFPRAVYPPDVAPSSGNKPAADGPDIIAYKRTVSRLGRWPWQVFDDTYSNGFAHGKSGNVGETGVAGVQRQQSILDTGWLGEATFSALRYCLVPEAPGFAHPGEQAMDQVAVNLIDEAYALFHEPAPPNENDVRAAISDFCRRSITAAAPWHYVQYRPMRYLGVSPDAVHYSDCSEHATEAYYWARQQTGIMVPDPNRNGYNGWGNTTSLVQNPVCSSPFKVGDLAIYGTSVAATEHVATCYIAGDLNSSEWCSNGSEAAPYAVDVRYRPDLLCIVRPPLRP